MSHTDTDVPRRRDTGALVALRFRHERWVTFCRSVGVTTAEGRATLAGTDRKAINRAQAGRFGSLFIRRTVTGLRRAGAEVTLSDLFEVVDQ